ncbi:MAG: heavy-metal-associated domain-containing protein [Maribacter sp.]|nr:heavy-metal-associated domain-containing protein [Maribacter sp.]
MKTSIIVQNLKCGGCAKTISSKLTELGFLSEVTVDVETAMVSFVHDNIEEALRVKDQLKALGYPSIDTKNTRATKAISFIGCAKGKMTYL